MLQNYFKIAWRNLMKNKVFSFINILGLTIGITCCMMIFLFIINEFSVDKFHAKKDKIYRVMRQFDVSKNKVPYLSPPYAMALANDFPDQIKKVVRVWPNSGLVSFGNNSFNEGRLYITDADFFTLFSFALIKGDPATVLKDPASVVLSETTAKKYFGNEDPIGKVIELDKQKQLKVTGIVKDVPPNSHLEFDLVVPISNYVHEDWFKGWLNNSMFTYVLLDGAADQVSLEKQFPQFMEKYMGKELARIGLSYNLSLTPLTDIYFESHGNFDPSKHGDKSVVFIFLSIAALILLIACINFMNLSTIRAVERSKEVGLRKVMGALRNHLVWQFVGESVLLTVISSVLSIGLLQLLMPVYNQLLDHTLAISWNAWPIYLFVAGVILVVGFLAGSYPAFFLSGFSPIEALKGKLKLGKGGAFFRQALVVVQFSISVLLVIGTIIIMQQMNYVKSKELGYDKEQTVIVRIDNNEIYDHRYAFKNELQSNNNVQSVSLMAGEPGGFFDIHAFEAEGKEGEPWKFNTGFADFDFVKTLGLKVIAGRDLSGQYATDTMNAALINRTAAAKLGYTPEEAIGKWIRNKIRDSVRRRIVGVIEDFNFRSLKQPIEGLVIAPGDDNRVVLIKLKPGTVQSSMATIKHVYNKVAPGYPFAYSFLDQKFEVLYRTDVRQQTILAIFSGLAIFIACLGLFGLASYTAAKRTKEIGVRKVLGSSIRNILLLLSKDLMKPVLVATIIAVPVGYYAMNNWLQHFAYRISLHWWIFVLAAMITVSIALITIGFKAMKAALANPVKSLRSE